MSNNPVSSSSKEKREPRGKAGFVDQLREDITSGLLLPRERLVEQDLAARHGVSRATVRSALTHLTAEGMVERIPNRGARVRSIPREEAVEILEVRSELESLCAYRAAERVSEDDRHRLRQIAQRMKDSVAAGDLLEYGNLNKDLHQAVLDISGHRTATAIVERLKGQMVRHQYGLTMRADGTDASLSEHLAIAEAICEQQPEQAREAMRAHLGQVTETLRSVPDDVDASLAWRRRA